MNGIIQFSLKLDARFEEKQKIVKRRGEEIKKERKRERKRERKKGRKRERKREQIEIKNVIGGTHNVKSVSSTFIENPFGSKTKINII